MAALDRPPLVHQVAADPRHYFGPQPRNVDRRVVPPRVLALGVRRPRHVHHVDQRVGVPQVVEELVAQPLALVRARHQPGHVQQLDGHAAPPVDARAVVGLAALREAVARAGAVDLEVADGSLWVDRGEAGGASGQ